MGAFAVAMGNAGKAMLSEAGSQIGTGIGGVLGYGIGELFGHNRRARRQQLEQQNKLNALSFEWNKRQMNYAQELEKQMYQYTFDMNKPEALKNLYKQAGLNPALMYGTSASGVSGTSVGGGKGGGYNSQAASEGEIIQSKMAIMEMGLQLQKLKSDIKVNDSIADLNESSANLNDAKTKTEDQQRDKFIAKLYYEGKLAWLESFKEEVKLGATDDPDIKANIYHDDLHIYGGVAVPEDIAKSMFGREIMSAIEATEALKDNHIANTALTNEQTKYYFLDLMADIVLKDSQAALNNAKKLESEWQIGEYVNWKTILEAGLDSVNSILNVLMAASGKGIIKKLGNFGTKVNQGKGAKVPTSKK